MARPIVPARAHELAAALREGAARLGLTRPVIAREVLVTPRTVSRWNNGQLLPHPFSHERLVALFEPAGPDIASRIRASLGMPAPATAAPPPRPAAPPAPPPARDDATLKRDLDHALYAAAETIDRSPRRVRGAFTELLRQLAAMNVSLADAHRLLAIAPPETAKPKPPRANPK